jgi:hypothetical protein
MRIILGITLLLTSAAAQVVLNGGTVINGGTSVGGVIIADLNAGAQGKTGLDSYSAQTIGPNITDNTQLLNTNFLINVGHANDTIQIVDGTDSKCASLNSGHNCVVINHATADGGMSFGTYLALSPSYSAWNGNPYVLNRGQNSGASDGGVWFTYKVAIDSNTDTYIGNTNAQIKVTLQRTDSSGGYKQTNANGGSPGYGALQDGIGFTFSGSTYRVNDDPTTGTTFRAASGTTTSGVTVKCHVWRDTLLAKGQTKCSQNGVESINTLTGNCGSGSGCSGGITNFNMNDSSATNVAAFHIGIRYFAVCTNACSDTTLRLWISGVKVCTFQCFSYP